MTVKTNGNEARGAKPRPPRFPTTRKERNGGTGHRVEVFDSEKKAIEYVIRNAYREEEKRQRGEMYSAYEIVEKGEGEMTRWAVYKYWGQAKWTPNFDRTPRRKTSKKKYNFEKQAKDTVAAVASPVIVLSHLL